MAQFDDLGERDSKMQESDQHFWKVELVNKLESAKLKEGSS